MTEKKTDVLTLRLDAVSTEIDHTKRPVTRQVISSTATPSLTVIAPELLPPRLGLPVVHDEIGVAQLAGRAEVERAPLDPAVERDRRVAERAEGDGDGEPAEFVVDDLVPDQDLQRVGARLAADRQLDHRLARLDKRRREDRGKAGRIERRIARQVRVFAERGEHFEWKLHAYDRPPDLPRRLRAAGFVPEDEETVVIAPVDEVAGRPLLPEGVSLREVTDRNDLDRTAAFKQTAWGEGDDPSWIAESLETERTADPHGLSIVVVEAGGAIVCAGWVRFERGTDFATLWGGATLPTWRGRGIYRASVAYRASLAAERGFRFIEVDAPSDSRPILERLGFSAVTTTTPYVWSPPSGVAADTCSPFGRNEARRLHRSLRAWLPRASHPSPR